MSNRLISPDRHRRTAARGVASGVVVAAAVALVGLRAAALAWVVPAHAPAEPPCPPIPDAQDIVLSPAEYSDIEEGKIVVRVTKNSEQGRVVQAIGYLSPHPVWLFDLATDSALATEMVDVIRRVEVIESRPDGKVFRAAADASVFLPEFEYTLIVSYLDDATGQCWAQREGDFRRNEGSHSYLWDPDRRETLTVLTFDLELKGFWRIIPERVLLRLTGRTLPGYMRALERMATRMSEQDPERAARIQKRWNVLRPMLEGGARPGRVWRRGAA